jgi:uncharacterized membrane protein (DUF2068 family)
MNESEGIFPTKVTLYGGLVPFASARAHGEKLRRRKPKSTSKPQLDRGLMLVGAFKLVEALALLALGFGVLRMLHRDVADEVRNWITFLRVDPENVFIHRLLARLALVDEHNLKQLSIGTFIYAAIRLTEGLGLVFRKRWAAYFTVIVTASFIPLEVIEILRHVTWVRIALLLLNILIVIYLIYELIHNRKPKPTPSEK